MEIWIVIGIVVLLLVAFAFLYNRLVALRNAARNAFAQIDVQLQRRHDLIPALVEAVKGYMTHERGTLEAVVKARNDAEAARSIASPTDAGSMRKLNESEGALGVVLGRLFALSEAYPDLKASANFLQYQEELTSTENRVAYARQAYNDSVETYRSAIESIPANLIAGPFGFRSMEYLDFSGKPEIKDMPSTSFA